MAGASPQWEKRYSRKLVWTDVLIIAISVLCGSVASTSKFLQDSNIPPFDLDDSFWSSSLIGGIYGVIWLAALSLYKSRHPSVFGTGPEEYNRVFSATLMSFGITTLVFYMLGTPANRSFLVVAFPVGIGLMAIGRLIWRKRLHFQRRRRLNTYRALLVGEQQQTAHIARQLRANTLAGFEIVGAVTRAGDSEELIPGVPVVADYPDIISAAQELNVDTIIITSSDLITPERLRNLGWEFESMSVDMVLATALTDVAGPRIHTRPISGLPLVHVEYPQFHGWRYFGKRGFDIVGSLALIVVLSPLLLVLAILVRKDSHGPAIFKQQRLGLRGEPFTMYKFRSMSINAENELPSLLDRNDGNDILFKMKNDPRVTPLGRSIRRHSLDELPQIFNVLKGDMSLVGPRPPLAKEAIQYEEWVNRRLFVRPGISGLWQVNGRSNLSWEDSIRLDLYYVENWSLMGDLLILWRTIRTVFKGDGAY